MKLFRKIIFTACLLVCASIGVFWYHAAGVRNPSDFYLCGAGTTYPYYAASTYESGDFYALKQYFKKGYVTPRDAGEDTALMCIQFMINCHGEAGNYQWEVYDSNYRMGKLPESITNQLIELTKKFHGWEPPLNRQGESINLYKFLSFRIVDGELIEVLPK